MTDLSNYRIGPAKTRDGRDAVIYAIYPGQKYPIHGAIRRGPAWVSTSWFSDGRYSIGADPEDGSNLLPNAIPAPATVARWLPLDGSLAVSDTERKGWTRVEVPVQPVRGDVMLLGYKACDRWFFAQNPENYDTNRILLPTENGDLVCGEYRDGMGNVIKVERINE